VPITKVEIKIKLKANQGSVTTKDSRQGTSCAVMKKGTLSPIVALG
jgi:hypothetical protein